MKNLSIKILFLCLFAGCVNGQILFEPPKEWANSVPQSVIDASPAPILAGKPLQVSSSKCKKLCGHEIWFFGDAANRLFIDAKSSLDSRDTDENYKRQYPDWNEQSAFSGVSDTTILWRVMSYIRTRNWQKALDYSNRVITKWYGSPMAYFCRGMIFYALGQKDRALKDLDASIFWVSQMSEGTVSDLYYHARLQRGIIYARMGNVEKAVEDSKNTGWRWENASGGEGMLVGKKELLALINQTGNADDSTKLSLANTFLDKPWTYSDCKYDAKVLEFAAEKKHRKYESLLYLTKGALSCKNLPKAYEYAKQFIEFTRAEQKKEDTVRNRNAVRIAYQIRREMYESEGKFAETVYDALEAYKMVSNRFENNLILTDEEYSYAEVVINQLTKVPASVHFTLEEMSNFLALKSSVQATQRKNAAANDAQMAKLAGKDHSSFRLCNKYGEPLTVAVSYPDKTVAGRYSDGWKWLKNGECTDYVTVNISDIERYGKPKYAAYSNEINLRNLDLTGFTCLPKMNGVFSRGHHLIPLSCEGDYYSYPADTIDIQANKILTVNLEKNK